VAAEVGEDELGHDAHPVAGGDEGQQGVVVVEVAARVGCDARRGEQGQHRRRALHPVAVGRAGRRRAVFKAALAAAGEIALPAVPALMVPAGAAATAAVLATLPQSAKATDSSSNTASSTAR
jgi:hypothetical protein